MTQQELIEMFDYDPVSGNLIHRFTVRGGRQSGSVAGSPHCAGYKQITIRKKYYLIHRLVWMYHHGYMPRQLDHINRDRSDNRIENLRECTYSQNRGNACKKRNNRSGHKGVFWHGRDKRWVANIAGSILGYFSTAREAAAVYDAAAQQYFGEFALTNEDLNDETRHQL